MNHASLRSETKPRICPASPSDLRTLIEEFEYPLVVCGDEGEMLFGNRKALALFGDRLLHDGLLPDDWIDTPTVDWEDEHGSRYRYALRWDEVIWQGNPAWFLSAVPAAQGEAQGTDEELRQRLEQSLEMAAEEVQRRQQIESERERLEAKLKDLHQRSVAKIEAARSALENERLEREALLDRIARLKAETDDLRVQLDEKERQLADSGGTPDNGRALQDALERTERARALQRELEGELELLREKFTLTSARLKAVELERDQVRQQLDGRQGARDFEEAELRARIEELEVQLAERSLEVDQGASSSLEMLEQECRALRRELAEKSEALRQLEESGASAREAELDRQLRQAQSRCDELESTVAELRTVGSEELDQIREALRRAQQESAVLAESSRVEESARIAELEAQLAEARAASGEGELVAARLRILELERELTQVRAAFEQVSTGSGPGPDSSDWERERVQLVAQVQQGRAALEEMSRELHRVKNGDLETKKLAYADQLTGLPNVHLTNQYLQVCFDRSNRSEGSLALLMLDLDHFRRVNEAMGTKLGDQLLRLVGERIQQTVIERDTAIARRGEDEFMIVSFLEGASAGSDALLARVRGISNRLQQELAKPFEVNGQRVQISVSVGIALYPGPAPDRETLVEQAEHAMYKAKEAGRNRALFFSEEVRQERERRKRVEDEVRQGVAAGQFALLYQPIYELSKMKVRGVEALVRWSHPLRGEVHPAEFLEVAEESGMILPLGEQLISEAFEVAKQKFMKRHFLSLNLSHRQLMDSAFPGRFMKQLERSGVKPHDIFVEVSERATQMDPERVRAALGHLAQWGVGVVLDDFGKGVCDLALLRTLPIRLLKIDGDLVKRIPSDREAFKLCQGLVRFAATLEVPAVAEGVESKEILEQVRACGCTLAQGFLLSDPVTPHQLPRLMG